MRKFCNISNNFLSYLLIICIQKYAEKEKNFEKLSNRALEEKEEEDCLPILNYVLHKSNNKNHTMRDFAGRKKMKKYAV